MSNLQNLQSWSKGQSGNPKGRPKGTRNRKTIYLELLEQPPIAEFEKSYRLIDPTLYANNIAEQIAIVLLMKALNGNGKACDKIMDYAFGKI